MKVQHRNNSQSQEWETIDYVQPIEVAQLNREYGWRKYRVVS